jgi:alkanesulfonate monooxygenase SsuD/methylene tetrahydromethanopterin reductase-like flavin-dependent oxidoreductase (luciferase family)
MPAAPGLTLFNYPTEEIVALAIRADELGFGAVWVGDHVFTPAELGSIHPYPGVGTGKVIDDVNEFSSVLILAGAIAAASRWIQVSVGVLVLPMRHPLLVANDLVTIAELAPGRFVFGAGAGWLVEEFVALGVPFKQRIGRLEEALEVIRATTAGGVVEHHGKHFDFAPLTLTNRAAEFPVMIGGSSEPALERAAVLGDGWIGPGGLDLDATLRVRERIEAIRAGRDVAAERFRYVVRVNPHTPDAVDAFRAAGFDDLVFHHDSLFPGLRGGGLDAKVAALEAAAAEFGVSPPA